jgi:hypothetical protein
MAEKYVVLHTGVGAWTQGQVIDREEIEAAGGGVGRLTSLSAVRPATPDEAKQERVPVSFGTAAMSPAAQMVLAEKDAEIDRLRRVIGDRQDAAAFLARAQPAAALPSHVQALAAEKDAEIDRLRGRLAEVEKGREGAVAETQKQAEAAKQAAQSSGSTPPAGATPVLNPEDKPLAEELERQRQEAKAREEKPPAAPKPEPPKAAAPPPPARDEDFDQPKKGKK